MKRTFLIVAMMFVFAPAFAAKIRVESCSTELAYDKFSGDCGGHGPHPCEAETIPLGATTFTLTFDQATRLGSGELSATDLSGRTEVSALQCRPDNDRNWISCETTDPVLNGQHLYLGTNVKGIGSGRTPIFFMPVFVGDFNAPNGHVNTSDNCVRTETL